jgi:membrane protease YdiL (CAAX protease family)
MEAAGLGLRLAVGRRSHHAWVKGVTASPLRRRLIDGVWSVLPGPGWAVNSTPAAVRGRLPLRVTPALAAFQLLIRNPFTVAVEETFFQGFLYPRLGSWAPLKVAVLSTIYHLPQWWTMPTILPWASAISIARELSGNVWPGIAIHYSGNAAFVLNALPGEASESTKAVWFRSLRHPAETRHPL